jgi:hypothetical protein
MIGNLPFNCYQKITSNGKIFLIIIYNVMTDTISFSHLYNWCVCKLNKVIFRLLASISPSFHLELYCPSFVLRKLNKVIFRLLSPISPSFHLELYCPSSVLQKLNKVIFRLLWPQSLLPFILNCTVRPPFYES